MYRTTGKSLAYDADDCGQFSSKQFRTTMFDAPVPK
jgi:hypothetical protein